MRERGKNGPPKSAARGGALVIVLLDDGADLGLSMMAVGSIFELRRRDTLHDNQLNEYR